MEETMANLVDAKHIFLGCDLSAKEAILQFVSDKAMSLGIVDSAVGVLDDLHAREAEISTGLQDGFAIPHAKSSHVLNPSVLFVRTLTPVSWGTLDDSEVSCVFALLVPDKNEDNAHLKMLSRLAVNLMDDDFKKQITELGSAEEIASLIQAVL